MSVVSLIPLDTPRAVAVIYLDTVRHHILHRARFGPAWQIQIAWTHRVG